MKTITKQQGKADSSTWLSIEKEDVHERVQHEKVIDIFATLKGRRHNLILPK